MQPEEIHLNKEKNKLTLIINGLNYDLSAEYLRVCSPSAEIRGHGEGWKIIGGKKDCTIYAIKPVGHYAIQIIFSDGHSTGIYSWAVLWDLIQNEALYWENYLKQLELLGKKRNK